MSARSERPLPSCPITVRCYDNGGETADRYTVVYHGNQVRKRFGGFVYLEMSAEPFHPQGIGQHGESREGFIDMPAYSHLGKRIPFASLPPSCRTLVINDLKGSERQ